ncbi:MAG TPA: tripartite tricarboxylate transporter TctB family protein [Burkholderiales bacterium]
MRAGFLLAVLFVAGGYTWVAFAELSYLSSAGRLGPGFFPRIIGTLLVAICLASLWLDARRAAPPESPSPFLRVTMVVASLSAALVAAMYLVGGLLAMIAFMAAALWTLNRGRPLQNALIAVLLPLALYLMFRVWLNAAMPRGLLELPF